MQLSVAQLCKKWSRRYCRFESDDDGTLGLNSIGTWSQTQEKPSFSYYIEAAEKPWLDTVNAKNPNLLIYNYLMPAA